MGLTHWLQYWLHAGMPPHRDGVASRTNRRLTWGFVGAACRNRTDDLLITSETLCRLS
jgi:hypothetical protein